MCSCEFIAFGHLYFLKCRLVDDAAIIVTLCQVKVIGYELSRHSTESSLWSMFADSFSQITCARNNKNNERDSSVSNLCPPSSTERWKTIVGTLILAWKSGFVMETSNRNNEKEQEKKSVGGSLHCSGAGACNYHCCHNNGYKTHFLLSAASWFGVTQLHHPVGLRIFQLW